jgi:hypothetical protein
MRPVSRAELALRLLAAAFFALFAVRALADWSKVLYWTSFVVFFVCGAIADVERKRARSRT